MESRRPLAASIETLTTDFGTEEANEILKTFSDSELMHLLGTLNWPGVGTRWREFVEWCKIKRGGGGEEGGVPKTPAAALRSFGRHLGRVTTYRALAIDDEALQKIWDVDCIFPSGQLRVSAEHLEEVVRMKGLRTVCVARLFIAQLKRLLGHDPSISLHDDWQTTSLIASGYASSLRKVHLFELSCPKVESIGWTLQEVAEAAPSVQGFTHRQHPPWFCFSAPAVPQGIWFDGRMQRTERYGLYGVPFLSKRLSGLFVFQNLQELREAVMPFCKRMASLHARDTGEEEQVQDGGGRGMRRLRPSHTHNHPPTHGYTHTVKPGLPEG